MLLEKPDRKVVFIVPDRCLAEQQCEKFWHCGFGRRVNSPDSTAGLQPQGPFSHFIAGFFHGDTRQLLPSEWAHTLKSHSVIVCTAGSLHNVLTKPASADTAPVPAASMSDIDLLIVDEAHHTDEEHVYNKIMVSCAELLTIPLCCFARAWHRQTACMPIMNRGSHWPEIPYCDVGPGDQ